MIKFAANFLVRLRRHDTFAPDTTMAATTVPTQDNILVPETLLKKRKSQERAREERAIATREKRGTLAPDAMDNKGTRRSR